MLKPMLRNALMVSAVLLVWGASEPVIAQGQQAVVIQGGTLIDGNGGAPVPNSVIVIQGNRITAVGRVGAVQIPAGAQVIDANGKWIVPGLWDSQTVQVKDSLSFGLRRLFSPRSFSWVKRN